MTWNNDVTPQFLPSMKPSQNPRKCKLGNIRNRWTRHNHWFNPSKTNRYNTLDVNLTEMNKINIIKLIPPKACECSVDACTYYKYKATHPSPIPSDWSREDWDGEKAKMREQRSLIDLDFPKTELTHETNPDILNKLPIQNLCIQEDREEQEKLSEMTDTLVLPPEVAAVTPMSEETEWEDIIEGKEAEGLMEQEQKLQEDEEEYAIYVAGISEEEESGKEMDSDESS